MSPAPRFVNVLVAHTDGRLTEQQIRDDLEPLQTLVGGSIEYLPLQPGAAAYCNEDGLLDGLPANALASRVVAKLRPDLATTLAVYGLRGDVVFIGTTPAGNHRDRCPRPVADLLAASVRTATR